MKLKKLMNDFLQDYLKQNEIEFSEWSVNVNNCLLYTSDAADE